MPHEVPITAEELANEVWKPIPGYPGYDASDIGRIRSWRNCGNGIREIPKILKQAILLDKRLRVTPVVNGKTLTLLIHRAVLLAHVGPCPKGMVSCHEDDNCWDNRLINLRWGTPKSNYEDQKRHGKFVKGEQSGNAKLTEKQVIEIRQRFANGEKSTDLAKEYGVLRTHITDIKSGRVWPHAGGPIHNPKTIKGENNGLAKLTANDVKDIRQRYANGERIYLIKRDYPVSDSVIGNIIRHKIWKHI